MNKSKEISPFSLFAVLFVSFFSQVTLIQINHSSIITAVVAPLIAVCVSTVIYYLMAFLQKNSFIKVRNDEIISMLFAVIIILVLVYSSTHFLTLYGKMFTENLNTDADVFSMVVIILLVSIFGAINGVTSVSRTSIFVFAFTAIGLVILLCGNLSNFGFENLSFQDNFSFGDLLNKTVTNISYIFVLVILFFLGYSKDKKHNKSLIVFGIIAFLTLCLINVLTIIVLGKYSQLGHNNLFTLFRTASFGGITGFQSFYLIISTASIFVILSLCMASVKKAVNKKNNNIIYAFSILVIILYFCCRKIRFVNSIISNQNVFVIVTAVGIGAILLKSIIKSGDNSV